MISCAVVRYTPVREGRRNAWSPDVATHTADPFAPRSLPPENRCYYCSQWWIWDFRDSWCKAVKKQTNHYPHTEPVLLINQQPNAIALACMTFLCLETSLPMTSYVLAYVPKTGV